MTTCLSVFLRFKEKGNKIFVHSSVNRSFFGANQLFLELQSSLYSVKHVRSPSSFEFPGFRPKYYIQVTKCFLLTSAKRAAEGSRMQRCGA